jgi:membrane protease YdiL (CAAX protease family)
MQRTGDHQIRLTPSDEATYMKRHVQLLTIAIIAGYWIWSIWTNMLRPGAGQMPDSVRTIAVFVCIKTLIAFTAIWFLLRANGERVVGLGLGPGLLARSLLRGLLLAIGLFVVFDVMVGSIMASVAPGMRSDSIKVLFTDPHQAPLWIFAAIVGGGFIEELIRSFILTRFEKLFGRPGLIFAVLADTIMFGVGHSYQGLNGMVKAGLTGLVFSLIFLQRRRVSDAMVAHAGFDLLGIATAYAIYSHSA